MEKYKTEIAVRMNFMNCFINMRLLLNSSSGGCYVEGQSYKWYLLCADDDGACMDWWPSAGSKPLYYSNYGVFGADESDQSKSG